jgi:hypothetical protein
MNTNETNSEIARADRKELAAVAASVVTRGDISGLSPEEMTSFYLSLCERLRLDASTQPFARLRLNGKEILYPTRGATDQLASVWGVDRELVETPAIIDTGAGKIIRAVCRASWRGRSDVSTGAVPVPAGGGEALCNALLKCETKAKRRATLSILGLGMLDETEIESIPAAAKATVTASTPAREPAAPHLPTDYVADLAGMELPAEAVSVWIKHRATLAQHSYEHREHAWKLLIARVEGIGNMKNAKVWLKRAIAEEDARRNVTTPEPQTYAVDDGVIVEEPAPTPATRDPLTTPSARRFVELLAAADSTDGVVAAWLECSGRFASDGSDVLDACRQQCLAAWTSYGGAPSREALSEAIAKARDATPAAEASPPPRTTKRQRQAAAPLSRSVPVMTPAELAGHLALKDSAGEVAGAYWKRAGLWDEAGTLVACRTIVVDRLCALLSTDERAAYAWLDGCDPARRSERRSAETDRRQAR